MSVVKKIAKILLVGICIFVVAKVIAYVNRPYSPTVSVERIQEEIRQDRRISVKVNDREYMIQGSWDFANLFLIRQHRESVFVLAEPLIFSDFGDVLRERAVEYLF